MDSLIIRNATPSDADSIARVQVDTWRTTYDGIVSDDFLANMSYKDAGERWTQRVAILKSNQFIYVAEMDDSHVIGFASGGNERDGHPEFTGELYALYLLQEFQGQGIGKQLMQRSARQLYADDFHSMLVWVLADNPSRRFYEAMGGKLVGSKKITIGGTELEEVAYGWRDLSRLFNER